MKRSSLPLGVQVGLFTLIRIVINTSYRMVYPFFSFFQGGLGVSLPAFSLVLTLRSFSGVVGPLLAPLTDRYGRRPAMLAGLGMFVLGSGLIALMPRYGSFLVGLFLMASAYQIFLPAMQAFLGDRVVYTERGRVMGLTELGWSLSFILGIPAVGWLVERVRIWWAPFVVFALVGIVLLGLLWWLVPRDPHGERHSASTSRLQVQALLHSPHVLIGLAMGLALTSANEMVNLVFGLWLESQFALQLAALGAASVVIGASELLGESVSALWVDRLGKERAVAVGIVLNSLAAVGLFLLGKTITGALIGLFLFYLTFEFALVSFLPLMSGTFPALRATVMAGTIAAFSLGRAVGAVLGPLTYGLGFGVNLGVAILFNTLALMALRRVHVAELMPEVPEVGGED
ncbi:MFS transporter [Thermanaerothrix sp.]|jgi:predicted MFS family arabinose efflux permease|uniref:MFS transporter n=1 Tax=Thermanaerothrix sp. TaxID=2972675 RepID=UPI002ADE4D07|nr:MFS transporter [Thermanaerothrix sp.]